MPPARDLACATCSVEGVRPWVLPLGFTVEMPLITLCSAAEGGPLRLSMLARSSATSGTTLGNLLVGDVSPTNLQVPRFLGYWWQQSCSTGEKYHATANICHACQRGCRQLLERPGPLVSPGRPALLRVSRGEALSRSRGGAMPGDEVASEVLGATDGGPAMVKGPSASRGRFRLDGVPASAGVVPAET